MVHVGFIVLQTLCDKFLVRNIVNRGFFLLTKEHPATVTISLIVTKSIPKTVTVSGEKISDYGNIFCFFTL